MLLGLIRPVLITVIGLGLYVQDVAEGLQHYITVGIIINAVFARA